MTSDRHRRVFVRVSDESNPRVLVGELAELVALLACLAVDRRIVKAATIMAQNSARLEPVRHGRIVVTVAPGNVHVDVSDRWGSARDALSEPQKEAS